MNTILVWVLVVVTNFGGHTIGQTVAMYDGLASLQDCEHMKSEISRYTYNDTKMQCIQVHKVK